MKRSKIFLGLITCCLAVAGAVAAKVTHFGTKAGTYFNTDAICVQGNFPCSKAMGMLRTCIYDYTSGASVAKTAVYTNRNPCTTLLKYSGD